MTEYYPAASRRASALVERRAFCPALARVSDFTVVEVVVYYNTWNTKETNTEYT